MMMNEFGMVRPEAPNALCCSVDYVRHNFFSASGHLPISQPNLKRSNQPFHVKV